MSVDPARVRRALSLNVTELADSEYLVTGGAAEHVVRASRRPWRCDCLDATYGSGACKHAVAVYLERQLAPAVRKALRSVVEAQ
jgi:hypothetical protein